MIADGEIADPLAQGLDNPCGLMSEGHRHWARPGTVDDGGPNDRDRRL